MTDIIPFSTIGAIESYRAAAMAKYAEAQACMWDAANLLNKATDGRGIHFQDHDLRKITACDDGFDEVIRKGTDRAIWNHLIYGYKINDKCLEQLMDRKAHDEFRAALEKDPPPADADTIKATLAQLMSDAPTIFRRGIAEAFSRLDRRFRSHDGFKIGERVVFDRAMGDWGMWNHYAHRDEDIRDVERTFYRLDGKEMPDRGDGIIGLIDKSKKSDGNYKIIPFAVEDEYFRVRVFKNGNIHMWFKRDDLLRDVNRLLGEYYGDVLGAGSDAVEIDPLQNTSMTHAKNLGWFPTPEAVAQRVCDMANLSYWRGEKPMRVLEPSAGEGALALEALKNEPREGMKITCVELDFKRIEVLDNSGLNTNGHETLHVDFLTWQPSPASGLYDRVIMNPPFDDQRDIDHVVHACKFLAPGGKLVAVMSAGVEFRDNKKAVAFRKLVEHMGGRFWDLTAGSFKESGTMVNTCMVEMTNPVAKPPA